MRQKSVVDEIAETVREQTYPSESESGQGSGDQSQRFAHEEKAYYCSASKEYLIQNERKQWISISEGSIKRYLKQIVFRQVSKVAGLDSMIDDYLINLQTRNDVAMAMPIAGWDTGIHMVCGERVLVTKTVKPVAPRRGEWPLLSKFLAELLGEQTQYLYGWLKSGLKARREPYPFRPGQLMAFAGPGGCGKSLLQNIITEIYGGRVGKPYKFMIGKTGFNSQLFGCEHLAIEDQAASKRIDDRLHFGANIKNMLVNETQEYERKGSEALVISPFWRMTCTLNDEPECLLVLPPIDADLIDKIILLKASRATFPFDGDDLRGRRAFRESISRELPAFVSFLMGWRMPDRLKDQRYGVIAWQHPELLEALADLAPEGALLSLIDTLKPWDAYNTAWTGTANALQERLLEKDKHGRVGQLLKYSSACGTFLGRLAKRYPDRVEVLKRDHNKAIWKIHPPKEIEDQGIPD